MSRNGDPKDGAPKKRPSRRRPKPVPEPVDTEPGIEERLAAVLRRYGITPGGETPKPEPKKSEAHILAPAGPKLKEFRERSGWEVSEIAERTRVPLDVLEAFEQGDPAAASKLELSDLELLVSACCGTLADVLGPDVAAVRRALQRRSRDPFDTWF